MAIVLFEIPYLNIQIGTSDKDCERAAFIVSRTLAACSIFIVLAQIFFYMRRVVWAIEDAIEDGYHWRLFAIIDVIEKIKYGYLYKVRNGAPPIHIKAIASTVNDKRCSLCWNQFSNSDVVVLGCGHQYHAICLRQWELTQYAQGEISYRCPLDKRSYSWTSKWHVE